MTVEIARGIHVDADARLLVEVNPSMLKTILGAMAIRQHRMGKIIQDGYDNNDYTFVDAAVIEKDKSYRVGAWAEHLLQSLAPERVEEEWYLDNPTTTVLRRYPVEKDNFYPVDDES